MANRFQPLVKPDGMIHTWGGPTLPTEWYYFNGFMMTLNGVLVARWGVGLVAYFHAGLAFTSQGQLAIIGGKPLYYDQGAGFSEDGRVHLATSGELPVRYDQGVGFRTDGSMAGLQVAGVLSK